MLKCYIIDDDQHSIDAIQGYIEKIPNLTAVGSNINPLLALQEIQKGNKPDIVFLDVEMPQLSGMDLAELLSPEISVIFITAHKQHALGAFEKNAIGFILKPFSFEMFIKALNKMNILLQKLQSIGQLIQDDKLFVKVGAKNKIIQLDIKEVFFISALDHYVNIHTLKENFVIHISMSAMEEKLSKALFARIHKTYIVNIDQIKAIEDNQVILVNGSRIPFGGDLYKKPFLDRINSRAIKKLRIN